MLLSLIWKELLVVFRDPSSRLSIIFPPLIQLFIFAFAATLDVKEASIGVLNRDNGEHGVWLMERFQGTPLFKEIHYLKAVDEIGPFIDAQKGLLVISIDERFSRNLDAGKKASVQLLCDGRKSNSAQILSGYASQIIEAYNDEYMQQAGIPQQNCILVPRNWFNPNTLYYWYNITSLVGLLSMITCLVVVAQSVARERELGTFDQLLVSPLAPWQIMVGKVIPGILVGWGEGIAMWGIGTFLLKVPFTGSFILFALSLLVFVASVSGVGLFISSISLTQQQAMLGTFVFILPSVLLSGYATPIENMPDWLQPVSYLLPLRYMLILSKGLFLKHLEASIASEQIWPMAVISLFTLTLSSLYFRKRLQ